MGDWLVSLCLIHEWHQREGLAKLLERREGRALDSRDVTQDLETPSGAEDSLDHLRTHLEPIEVFRRERIGVRHKIQHFVETLRGSGWTSESFDEGTRVLGDRPICQRRNSHRS